MSRLVLKKEEEMEEMKISHLTKQKILVLRQIIENKYDEKAHVKRRTEINKIIGGNGELCEYGKLVSRRRKRSDFEKITVIGRGAFGEVQLVREKATGKLYAMKILNKRDMLKRNQVSHVRAERDILSKCGSDWIVTLEYSFQDREYLYFVTEYCPGGDMMTWLQLKECFLEDEVRFFIAELLLSVKDTHSLQFVHRDLKPDNILICADGHIKLCDFGLCKPYKPDGEDSQKAKKVRKKLIMEAERILEKGKKKRRRKSSLTSDSEDEFSSSEEEEDNTKSPTTLAREWRKKTMRKELWSLVGSKMYIAPEVISCEYFYDCDYWSIGVIMYEMLYGMPPFRGEDAQTVRSQIIRWKHCLTFPGDFGISPEAEDLMKGLICDRKDRYSMEEIMNHKFFEGIDFNSLRNYPPPFIPELNSDSDTRYFDKFPEIKDFDVGEHVYFHTVLEKKHRNILQHDVSQLFYNWTFHKDYDRAVELPTRKKKDSGKDKKKTLKEMFGEEAIGSLSSSSDESEDSSEESDN